MAMKIERNDIDEVSSECATVYESSSNATEMELSWTSTSTAGSVQNNNLNDFNENGFITPPPVSKRNDDHQYSKIMKFAQQFDDETFAITTGDMLKTEMMNYPENIQRKIRRKIIEMLDEISLEEESK